jgi:cytidylate kinase
MEGGFLSSRRISKMSLITISRQRGSLGTEIAKIVSDTLNYKYVDKERIGGALADYGLPKEEVEAYDEKKPSLWESFSSERKKFLHLIQAVIYDFARQGNVVIVGRGGQVLLKDLPGAFHVRIKAPFDVRVKRIMEREGDDERHVERILRLGDRNASGYIRYLFNVDWDDQTLYDTIINTQKISKDTAVKMILDAVHSPELKVREEKVDQKLADLALAQKVEATLLDISGIDIRDSEIHLKGGVVTISGVVNSVKDKEEFGRKVSKIKGVRKVDNQLLVAQRYGV